jgi:hypothetical protein
MKLEQDRTEACPYCGEPVGLVIDCTLSRQEFVEDCQVCCRPIQFVVSIDNRGEIETLQALTEDE